jgi:hypothetical protein
MVLPLYGPSQSPLHKLVQNEQWTADLDTWSNLLVRDAKLPLWLPRLEALAPSCTSRSDADFPMTPMTRMDCVGWENGTLLCAVLGPRESLVMTIPAVWVRQLRLVVRSGPLATM